MRHVSVPSSRRPSSVISPCVTGTCPMIARSSVVLPAPFGPMIVVSLPDSNRRSTSHSTLMGP